LKEWTAPDCRNTPSTTNLEEEEIVDAPENDGNASMPEQVKRPNPWRKMMMMMIIISRTRLWTFVQLGKWLWCLRMDLKGRYAAYETLNNREIFQK